jgi:cysteine desulfurase family protein
VYLVDIIIMGDLMIYLDNAATTFPKPESTYYYMNKYTRETAANPGRGSHSMAVESAEIIFETRELLAEFFNIEDSMNIVFTKNCTESLNIAIKGVLKKGDHVITTSMEHNSVLRPLSTMESRGVAMTIVQADEFGMINPKDIEKEIRKNTRMVVSTHVSNLTGTIMPIEEIGKICREKGVLFMVDSAQSAGLLEIDVKKQNIDILAFPGHKNLFGPMGIGGLYVSEDVEIDTFIEGGTGSMSSEIIQPDFMPDKLESGTPNLPGIAGLKGGLEFILETGRETIRKREDQLVKVFLETISSTWNIESYGPKDLKYRSGVVLVNIKDLDSSELASILDRKYSIAVRPGYHCAPLAHKTIGTYEKGAVRFSMSWFNTLKDIEQASQALIKIAEECDQEE